LGWLHSQQPLERLCCYVVLLYLILMQVNYYFVCNSSALYKLMIPTPHTQDSSGPPLPSHLSPSQKNKRRYHFYSLHLLGNFGYKKSNHHDDSPGFDGLDCCQRWIRGVPRNQQQCRRASGLETSRIIRPFSRNNLLSHGQKNPTHFYHRRIPSTL